MDGTWYIFFILSLTFPFLICNFFIFLNQNVAVLFPYYSNGADLFGYSVALDGKVAVVGAPNRDSYVSGANSGCAFTFDLGL